MDETITLQCIQYIKQYNYNTITMQTMLKTMQKQYNQQYKLQEQQVIKNVNGGNNNIAMQTMLKTMQYNAITTHTMLKTIQNNTVNKTMCELQYG